MSKYLKLFNNHTQYTAFTQTDGFVKPNVSHCIQENEVHYNPIPETRVVVSLIVTDSSVKTKIYDINGSEVFEKIEIDGIEADITSIDADNGRVQLSEGKHIIKYTLIDDTQIVDYQYYNCTTFDDVFLPNTITYLGEESFRDCEVENISLPNSLTTISYSSLEDCSKLKSLNIPKSVSAISNNFTSEAFNADYALESINVDAENATYDSRNDCNAVIESATNKLIIGCRNTVIPSSVTSIGSAAFRGRSGIVNLVLSNDITDIGNAAFANCKDLENIVLPQGLTTINNLMFVSDVSLKTILIPSGVTSIGGNAFQYCTSLTSITVLSETPPTLGASVFFGANDCPIYVPSESVTAYKAASGWSSYASRIQAIP